MDFSDFPMLASFSYNIFIKNANKRRIPEILALLDIADYKQVQEAHLEDLDVRHLVVIHSASDWLVLTDNLFYDLYHQHSAYRQQHQHPILNRLSKEFDVFAFVCGDATEMYEFLYYEKKQLVRHFEVLSENHIDCSIHTDIGQPLSAENDRIRQPNDVVYIRQIAASLAIPIDFDYKNSLFYTKDGRIE